MIEHTRVNAEFDDVEQMVRAAGSYLEVSEDLRPRTLEQAREVSRGMPTRAWSTAWAVVVVFVATCAGEFRGRTSATSPLEAIVSANCDQLHVAAQQQAALKNVDPSWSLVDAFSDLRQRQFSLVQDAF